ncbi:MAG: GNAT family N-acetyltransferase [Clostridia bacterium]|nr:GNAT family N-acetyltransferase [Clostridia bacterium]
MNLTDIITDRLTIRRINTADWESVKRIWDDQKQSVYACYDKPNDTDPEAVRKRIEKWASAGESMEHMFFAVCLNGSMIGYVAFNQRDTGYETGYCFHSDHQGKGYAKESLTALITAIRQIQPDAIITAGTALKNIPSVNLLHSIGFRQTGTERLSFCKDAAGQDILFDGGIFELAAK